VLALLALAAAGCAGYRLGTTLPPGIRSVHVPAFVNRTEEPEVETEATRAVLSELQQDGTLRVADAGNADTVLRVTLTDYRLEPVRYDEDRIKAAAEYRLRLLATIEFARTQSEDVLLKRNVEGESTFDVVGDLSSSKARALPDAAQDLAHDIVESVVEYW
jgi:hypothetical protein